MVKVKSEIMFFLVNVSPSKQLDVATSNFADALVRSKAGICEGVALFFLHYRDDILYTCNTKHCFLSLQGG